ncbi:MAG: PD-(D/E)XK nuclease-like domain-containing protein, partial [Methylobacter sp.]
LLHTMVLEQHDVEKNYVIMPKFDGRTNAGKAQAAEFKASNNKIVIPEDDYQRCEKMATNVLAIYGDIIEAGIKERSYFAEINGVICKARPDCLTGPDDYDLKSFTPKNMDFSDLALERHIDRMGYQLSAAFRNIVRRSLGHDVGDSYLIFVSTSPGHMTRTIQIDPQWIADSEEIVHQLIYKRSVYINNDIELSEISVIDDRNRKYNAY